MLAQECEGMKFAGNIKLLATLIPHPLLVSLQR